MPLIHLHPAQVLDRSTNELIATANYQQLQLTCLDTTDKKIFVYFTKLQVGLIQCHVFQVIPFLL
jgi:hypothetical protein